MNLNQYDAYFFDLDGTLIDSSGDLADAINQVRSLQNLSQLTHQEVEAGVGHGASALIKHCFPQALPEHLPELRNAFTRAYGSQLCKHTYAYAHVEDVLHYLKNQPQVKLALITNKPSRFAMPLLKALGWSELFDLYLYGDSLAERKPSSLPITHALQHFNLEAHQALFIGDTEVDAQAATSAQVPLAIVAWGRAAKAVTDGTYGTQTQVVEFKDFLTKA
ncbi:MAG: phosphoglycolate phosphatase [Myxococcales bacterium]|nr:phosphoglycolate phosphatase [Myxococcales bacterium]